MVKEEWRDLELAVTVHKRRIAPFYQVSNLGRVRRTTETHMHHSNYLLKILWKWGAAHVSLIPANGSHAFAVKLRDVLNAAWPTLYPNLSRTSINELNILSDKENSDLHKEWEHDKRELRNLRRRLREEAKRKNGFIPHVDVFPDPWKAGEIPQRPHIRTPDPAWGF